jgi:hypothetical protein
MSDQVVIITAYDCIEGVVHIGAYKNDWRSFGQIAMGDLCKPFPYYDLMSSSVLAICESVFLKPMHDETIMNIIMGRIKVFIGIDFDKFIEFSNHLGIKADWSTSKELHQYLDSAKGNAQAIFSFDNKGIKLEIDGRKMFLGHGFFMKMIFDHFLPSTMILKYQQSISNSDLREIVPESHS